MLAVGGLVLFAPVVHAQTSGTTPPPPPVCSSSNAGALYTDTGTSPSTVYTCSYYNLSYQWVVNPSYGGIVYYPTLPSTCSGGLPLFTSGYPSTEMYLCENGVPTPFPGTGTVTNFSASTWPSWLTPSVANSTSTPTLSVSAATIPISAGGTGATTAAGAVTNLLPGVASDGANGIGVTGNVAAGGGFTQTGTSANTFTGATTLPVIDNGGQVFNVKAYGANGNGTTDDTAAIQAAITAAVVTGGTVFFPPGTYDITSTLGVPSQKVRLVGASELSVEILCNVSSGDCIKFAPNLSSFRDADGGLYHLSVWLNGTNQIGVHTVDFFQGFHLVDANIERSSATYGVGSIGWLAENDGAFTETQTERSVLNHAGFAYDDIGIKAEDTASSGLHNSLEHSQWLDVRWNLGTNQIAIQLANDMNMTDSYINGTVNPVSGATGVSIFSLTGTSDTNPIYGTIYIDGSGTGITGATTASGTVLVYNGFMGTYASNSCVGTCILPPPNPSSFEAYSGLYSAKQLGIGDGSTNGYVTLIPSGGTTYLESSSTGASGNCQPVHITGAAASPYMMVLDCSGNVEFYGAVNAVTGYQINGSYGGAGQVLTSTGTGTTFAAPVASGIMSGTGTSATHTFTTPFTATPQCTVEPTSNVGTWYTSAESSTAITVTYSTSGTSNWDAICYGSGGVW